MSHSSGRALLSTNQSGKILLQVQVISYSLPVNVQEELLYYGFLRRWRYVGFSVGIDFSKILKFCNKFFYVMGKGLSGKLCFIHTGLVELSR